MSEPASQFETFVSPFGWRYGSHEMRRVWSEVHKRRTWRRLWVALAESEHELGAPPMTEEEMAEAQRRRDMDDDEEED